MAIGSKSGAAWLSVATNALLMLLKLVVGLLTGSVSVLSEAIHSGVDLVGAGIACFSVQAAERPADRSHPYGHGKIEHASALVEAGLILLAAAYLVYESYHRFFDPHPVRSLGWGIAVMALSAVTNWLLSTHLLRVADATDSPALYADGQQLRVDVFTSAGVLVTLALIQATGEMLLDPLIAIVLAGLLVKVAWDLLGDASSALLDSSLPAHETDRLRAALESDPRVLGYHRVRARRSGSHRHIDLHLLFDPEMSLRDAHALAEEVEDRIRASLPNVSVITHLEPATEEELAVQESEPGIWKGRRT